MAELEIAERAGMGLASVMARRGVSAAAIGDALELDAPERPAFVRGDALALVGAGPGAWLAIAEAPGADWFEALRRRLDGLASISDQSGAYAIFALRGPGARTLLQRGAFIDLDPAAFGPGSAATTLIAQIGAIVWQRDDAPGYEVAVFRSYAASFRDWIASASHGLGAN